MTAAALEMLDLDAGLRQLGYSEFRPGQREAITTLIERGKLLLVAPTGGVKSLCYQLPGSLLCWAECTRQDSALPAAPALLCQVAECG